MSRFLASILFAAVCCSAQEQAATPTSEPLKIQGTFLGQTVQNHMSNSRAKLRYAKLDLNDCHKASDKTVRMDGKVISQSDRYLCQQLAKAMKGEETEIRVAMDTPERTVFDHGTVVEFTRQILPDEANSLNSPWTKVLYDLEARLGKPQGTAPVDMQNGFGARYSYSSARWTTPTAYVMAREFPLNEDSPAIQTVVVVVVDKARMDRKTDPKNKPSSLD